MGNTTIASRALLQVICLAVFSITAAAQKYKIGAEHPEGGLVFPVFAGSGQRVWFSD